MAEEKKTDAAAKDGKQGKKKMLLIIAAVVLLAGGGAAFMLMGGGSSDKAAKKTAESAVEELKGEADGEHAEGEEEGESAEGESAEGEEGGHGKKASAEGGHGKAEEGEAKEGGHGGKKGEEAVVEEDNSLVYKMKAITANLNEPNFKRMVAIEFVLEARDKESYKEIEKTTYRLTDSIIGLLSNKTQADLKSEAGKDLLKQEVKARMDQILGKGKVVFVGFEQFYFF